MRNDEQYRHECEVRDCIKRFYPDGFAMKAHLELVAKRRGQAASDRLRADVLTAWQSRSARIKAERAEERRVAA